MRTPGRFFFIFLANARNLKSAVAFSRNAFSQVHWEPIARKTKKRTTDASALARLVLKTLHAIFLGDERKRLIGEERQKAARDAGKGLRKAMKRGRALQCCEVFSIINAAIKARGRAVLFPESASPARVEALSHIIARFIIKLRMHNVKIKNAQVYTAALVDIMSVGLTHQGVPLVPKLAWVAESAPGDVQYSAAAGINCRAMSMAVRHIKRLLVTDGLMANLELQCQI